MLPARSYTYWSEWASLCPVGDFSFGTLSPELEDLGLNSSLHVPQLPDVDVIPILCNLDPALFQDNIPKDLEGRATWTKTQRNKTVGCDLIHTVGELSTWVSFV